MLLQVHRRVVRRDGDPVYVHGPSRLSGPRVQRGLQVDVLEPGQVAGHHRKLHALGSEKLAYQLRNRVDRTRPKTVFW